MKKFRRTQGQWLAFLAVLVATCAARCSAQTVAPGQAAATPSDQTVYERGDVYLPISRVYILVGKTGLGHDHGIIGQIKQGHINLNGGPEPSGLVFDMGTFAADTPEARKFVGLEGVTDASTQQEVNANMRGSSVLDVARFGTASFAVKQITKLPQPSPHGLPQYQLVGDFTLHGTSQQIQVIAEAEEQNGWTHLRGSFYMLQSQFGITPFTKAFGAVGVADKLSVWGDIWIAKQRQVAQRPTTTR